MRRHPKCEGAGLADWIISGAEPLLEGIGLDWTPNREIPIQGGQDKDKTGLNLSQRDKDKTRLNLSYREQGQDKRCRVYTLMLSTRLDTEEKRRELDTVGPVLPLYLLSCNIVVVLRGVSPQLLHNPKPYNCKVCPATLPGSS